MIFTEEEEKNGYADYCRAQAFIDDMNDAIKDDGIKLSETPEDVQETYKHNLEIIKKYKEKQGGKK